MRREFRQILSRRCTVFWLWLRGIPFRLYPFSTCTSCRTMNREAGMSWAPVYNLVKQIPRGRVVTYGGLAKFLSLRGGARAAGRALAGCPSGRGIPWHRVIGAAGRILLREPHASLQKKLLLSEGIDFVESRVNLKRHLWNLPGKRGSARRRSRGPRGK